jgi:hypothetical protein
MTTPTHDLRTAAAKIRKLATADGVPPGPWTTTPRYRKGTNAIVQYDVYKPPLPGSNTRGHKAIHPSRTDALYSAAMHPDVGLALADWLDSAAEDAEQIGPDHRALAVARAINGGEQQ